MDNTIHNEFLMRELQMNEWHKESKDEINKKIITLIVMLAAATCLAILFALASAHIGYVL
ncbi:hypothetical protein ICN28_08185 [Polynucleobacter sp. 30F-ANTBAC]|jgi:hypothetical protein|uniref:hypothetical protein n=1 Tax=Polynucleobacter sp. 30F-ANTBAC TaxID=2689095 RepID=UPI001C0E27FE|nr:hypothetical protein [Polynucleobacter sp. 30F-ANTBAC]MBU3600498.1 hypothetical protein [Polynucleobacter sp. 30F-ANTBAC]